MAFQKTGSQEELRATMSPERIAAQETVYQASRGGHFPVEDKPVPATPQDGPRTG
jgi:hypothetical protein